QREPRLPTRREPRVHPEQDPAPFAPDGADHRRGAGACPDRGDRQRRAGIRRGAQVHRRRPDRDRLRARVRLAHRGRRLRGAMLVDSIALRPPLRLSPGKKTDDPYAMLEARFTPRTVFMEVGNLDSTLALRAASYVERVYSIQVGQLQQGMRAPCNLRLVSCDGIRIPVPEATIDIAWSADF